ncbi:MAG: hypothetical protein ABFE07_29670 [Armatimonadia bacterium]
MSRYVAYDQNGVLWESGESPEAAIEKTLRFMGLDAGEAGLRVAPMTERLAEALSMRGYDAAHPPFDWEINVGGEADLVEG